MKWLLVCDPSVPVEEYGEVLSGVPSEKERAGCPATYRALYLEATLEQVKPLSDGNELVCRLLPVWEKTSLSPAELLVLERRVEAAQEAQRPGGEQPPPKPSNDGRNRS